MNNDWKIGDIAYIPRALGIIPLHKMGSDILIDKVIISNIIYDANNKIQFLEYIDGGTKSSRCFKSLDDINALIKKNKEKELLYLNNQLKKMLQLQEKFQQTEFNLKILE